MKLDKRITASVCVLRVSGDSPILILTPCGICQERLFDWGESVEVATPSAQDAHRWIAKTLGEVQPYPWVNVFRERPLG